MPKANEMTSASGSIAQPMVQTKTGGGIRRHHGAAAVATIACERIVGILRSVVAADLQVRLPRSSASGLNARRKSNFCVFANHRGPFAHAPHRDKAVCDVWIRLPERFFGPGGIVP